MRLFRVVALFPRDASAPPEPIVSETRNARTGALQVNGDKLSSEELSDLLNELARGLKDLYGERYRGLVLYGSYARGEADEGSDVDVLLLLEGSVATCREIVRMGSTVWPISLEAGYTLSVLPVGVEDYLEPREPFFVNVRRKGLSVT